MWEYNHILDDNDYLMHYGVLGMKWGVHRGRSDTYTKATAKTKKLKDNLERAKIKQEKTSAKLNKKLSKRNWTEIHKGLEERAVRKEKKARRKVNRAQKKLDKWERAVEKNFLKGHDGKLSVKTLKDDYRQAIQTYKKLDPDFKPKKFKTANKSANEIFEAHSQLNKDYEKFIRRKHGIKT